MTKKELAVTVISAVIAASITQILMELLKHLL